MRDLVAFLRARLDDNEATTLPFRNSSGYAAEWRCDEVGGTVREVGDPPFGLPNTVARADIHATAVHIARHDPARVLADVESKRRIIDACVEVIGDRDLSGYGEFGVLVDDPNALAVTLAVETLRLLAEPFSDHPDYRHEWRL